MVLEVLQPQAEAEACARGNDFGAVSPYMDMYLLISYVKYIYIYMYAQYMYVMCECLLGVLAWKIYPSPMPGHHNLGLCQA